MASSTWTFGPGGIYTATWDGVSTLTVTYTSGGAFIASFGGQSLTDLASSPAYLALATGAASPSFGLLATTATSNPSGFALQNGTPTILSWTAPNDGQLHQVLVIPQLTVTSTLTGGQINVSYTDPGGTAFSPSIYAAGTATGRGNPLAAQLPLAVKAGTTVSISQGSAVTAGAGTLWAVMWGS